jgi:hypothetical protein
MAHALSRHLEEYFQTNNAYGLHALSSHPEEYFQTNHAYSLHLAHALSRHLEEYFQTKHAICSLGNNSLCEQIQLLNVVK